LSPRRLPPISPRFPYTTLFRSLFAEVDARHGRLDILVNAAGLNRRAAALEATPEDWDFVNDVNSRGTFFCCQSAARIMQRAGYRSEEHTSELQSRENLVCRLLL